MTRWQIRIEAWPHSTGNGAAADQAAAGERAPQELRGKNLACWCAIGAACHADVLLEIANTPLRCEAADAAE